MHLLLELTLLKKYHHKNKYLFYLDPPYFVKGSSLYLNHYNYEDHHQLASFLNSNPHFHWLLTYDNTPQISEFYKNRKSYEFSLNYHAHIAKKGREILIISNSITISSSSSDKKIQPIDPINSGRLTDQTQHREANCSLNR